MDKLLKGNKLVIHDPWKRIDSPIEVFNCVDIPSFSIFPIQNFTKDYIPISNRKIGVLFDSTIDAAQINNQILSLPLLCMHVGDFQNGQMFSLAYMIKKNFRYDGELRVTGNFLIDQLPHLKRCGVDSFWINEESDWEYGINLLNQKTIKSPFFN